MVDKNKLLAYLNEQLQEARKNASDDKDTAYGKVCVGEALAYADVVKWVIDQKEPKTNPEFYNQREI